MGVGQDLLDVPFPAMVLSLAQAIAKGQLAMDTASLNTMKVLANTKFDWVPEITEVLSPGEVKDRAGTPVTGVNVDTDTAAPVQLTMLQAGILPTFYQFTESIIEVKISISSKTTSSSEFEFGLEVKASADFFFGSASVASHVNYKSANTYSYSVDGSSLLRTTLRPTPPPNRVLPRFVMVNALVSPPQISIT
jgi:hypothetical protein